LLNFSHQYLRTAAEQILVKLGTDGKQEAHRFVADYFQRQPAGPRRTDELPWQLAQAGDWDRLSALLTDASFFANAWHSNEFEVKAYWTQIEAASSLRMVVVYRPQIEHPENEPDKFHLWNLSLLLMGAGHLNEALRLCSALVEHYRANGELDNLQGCIGNKGIILRCQGTLEEAGKLLKEQEKICRRLGNVKSLANCLGILMKLRTTGIKHNME
jgi:hypothetical protein